MKLTAQDLQIGDWVVYNGDVEYCYPIKVEGMDIATDSLIATDRDDVGFDGVWPIPITPEILEKNIFERITHVYPYPTYEYRDDKEKYVIRVAFPKGSKATKKNKTFVEIDEKNSWCTLDCEYVHKLQQAMRLCKIKKEIKL